MRAQVGRTRFVSETESHPNRIEFHSADDLRRTQGVGTQLKEQRAVDHRPGTEKRLDAGAQKPNAPSL